MYEVKPIYLDGEIEHYEIYRNENLVATCNSNEIDETIDYLDSHK